MVYTHSACDERPHTDRSIALDQHAIDELIADHLELRAVAHRIEVSERGVPPDAVHHVHQLGATPNLAVEIAEVVGPGIKWKDKEKEKPEKWEKNEKLEKREVKEAKAEKIEADGVFEPNIRLGPDPRLDQVIQALSGLTGRVAQLADQVEELKKAREG